MPNQPPSALRSCWIAVAAIYIPLMTILGCAGISRSSADQLLMMEEFQAAVVAYEAEEARSPEDAQVKRNLGMALLHAGNPEDAVSKLNESRFLNPLDSTTLLYLGRAQDVLGLEDEALRAYVAYLGLGGKSTPAVRHRIKELTRQRMKRDIRASLQREDSLLVVDARDDCLVVENFSNLVEDEDLAPLSRGLAAVMITDLSKVGAFRVLERDRLHVLEQELQLAAEGSATTIREGGVPGVVSDIPDSTLHPGTILGASQVVQGAFSPMGEDIRLSAALVNARDRERLDIGDPVQGPLEDVLRLEKSLVYQVLAGLGVEPSPDERAAIDIVPTEDFGAFLLFSRGLMLDEAGRFVEAMQAFEAALTRDPGFEDARQARETIEGGGEEFGEVLRRERENIGGGDESEGGEIGTEIVNRLVPGPLPDPGYDSGRGSSDPGEDQVIEDLTLTDVEKLRDRLPGFPPPPETKKRQ